MYTDAIRQVAAWLSNESLGVNALRSSVPVSDGDSVPAAVTIVSAADEDWAARGLVDRAKVDDGPLLLVSAPPGADSTLIEGGAEYPDTATLAVVIRFVARGDSKAALANQGWLTMRVAARSLVLQGKASNITRRNQVAIGPLKGLSYLTSMDQEGDDWIVDQLTALVGVNDAWAAGATAS